MCEGAKRKERAKLVQLRLDTSPTDMSLGTAWSFGLFKFMQEIADSDKGTISRESHLCQIVCCIKRHLEDNGSAAATRKYIFSF